MATLGKEIGRGSRTPSFSLRHRCALFKWEGLPEETGVHRKKLWPMYVSVASAPVLQGGPKSLYCLRGQDSSQVMTALIRGCREGMRGSVCALLLLLESKVATALDLALSSRGTQVGSEAGLPGLSSFKQKQFRNASFRLTDGR